MLPTSYRIPKKVALTLTTLGPILVPPVPDMSLDGVNDEMLRIIGKLFFQFPKLFRWGIVFGIRLFNFLPFLFGQGFKTFNRLSLEKQKKYVDRWAYSRFLIFRELFKTIKAMVISCYFSDKRIWDYIGYAPDGHLQERIALREKLLKEQAQP